MRQGDLHRELWRIKPVVVYAAALIINVLIALAVWPGFMSWDSIFALTQAREGVTSTAYPPIMAYIWRLTELFIPGPGGMILLQNGVLLLAIAHLLTILRMRYWVSVGFLVAFAATPIILGPMLVVWKDIGMSAFMAMGFSLLVGYSVRRGKASLILGLACIVIGTAYRLNAFPAVLPILIWLSWVMVAKPDMSIGTQVRKIASRMVVLTLVIIVPVVAHLSWRLPDFKPLNRSVNSSWILVYDLLGISVCSGEILVPQPFIPSMKPPMDINTLRSVYQPEHIGKSFHKPSKQDPAFLRRSGFKDMPYSDLRHEWLAAIKQRPGCYLWHRSNVLSHLLGLNSGKVFYITHPYIDKNKYGFRQERTNLTKGVINWVYLSAIGHFGKVIGLGSRLWFFVVLATGLLAAALWRGSKWRVASVAVYLSGLAYLAGNVVVVAAADARYVHWVAVSLAMSIALSGKALAEAKKSKSELNLP